MVAAFGVVHQAEELAHKLGEPFGTLVLTLTVVIIEVVLISSVMLGPSGSSTIARDSVFAVMMIIINGVMGVSLLLGGMKHGPQRYWSLSKEHAIGRSYMQLSVGGLWYLLNMHQAPHESSPNGPRPCVAIPPLLSTVETL
jgi:Ca2+/H+ antiporter